MKRKTLGLVVRHSKIVLEIFLCIFFLFSILLAFLFFPPAHHLSATALLLYTFAGGFTMSMHSFTPCKIVNVIQCQAVRGSCGSGILQIRGVVAEMSMCSR